MGVILRGIKNAFRNTIRTLSVTLILALSIGLALIMALSYQTVNAKIASVQSSIGNTITVTPAGAQGFSGGGNPLTEDNIATIKAVPNVVSVNESLNDRLNPSSDTNLVSAIDAGTLGARFNRRFEGGPGVTGGASSSATSSAPISVPITVSAYSDPTSLLETSSSKITSGTLYAGTSTDNIAAIGTGLATKNNLSVGSTFTAYSTTIKVVAIYDAGNTFANAGIYMPLKTLQTLSGQTNDVTSATVTVNDINNVDAAVSAIQSKLGSSVADVTSDQSQASSAIEPLQNIKSISLYSLIGALVAGAVITLLTMMMIVRERRREIGVLKAIGSSNVGVVMQFVVESLVLTLMGSVVGMIVGVAFSNPVLNALVTNSTSSNTAGGPGGFARGVARIGGNFGGGIRNAVSSLHATVGLNIIFYGLLVALGIAIIGSAIPAWLIAKVKPAEVMRGE